MTLQNEYTLYCRACVMEQIHTMTFEDWLTEVHPELVNEVIYGPTTAAA